MKPTPTVVTLVLGLLVLSASAVSAQSRPGVYVGPQIRDGFADIDAGIRDSIRDIRDELGRAGPLRSTSDHEAATLVLIVLGRGIVTNGSTGFSFGSVAGGVGNSFGAVVPNEKPTLTTVLRVGRYERRMQSEGGTWRGAAKSVVADVMAWWEANRTAVEAQQ
mgnify:CR=1 FL=1